MTGTELVTHAQKMLGYTTHTGEVDNSQNAELVRRGFEILKTVLCDLYRIKYPDREMPLPSTLNDPVELPEDEAIRVVVPGIAMYLALGAGDNENYNWWCDEYQRCRNSLTREPFHRVDTRPKGIW